MKTESGGSAEGARAHIVGVAAELLRARGPGALTTRGVAKEAGLQAPAIYRLFGDKDGLLDAVTEHVLAEHVAKKAADIASTAGLDPFKQLRRSWLDQIAFGIANPALFARMSDPARVQNSAAMVAGTRLLQERVRRIAATGRLRVSEHRAVDLLSAAGSGLVLRTLATPPDERDPGLPDTVYESVIAFITVETPHTRDPGVLPLVVALQAIAPQLGMLTVAERGVLVEWLTRAISHLEDGHTEPAG